MQLVVVTPPVSEPITLDELKRRLRITESDDDDDLAEMLAAARTYAELITRRQFMPATFKMVLDRFPQPSLDTSSANWYGPAWGTGPGPLTLQKPEGRTGFEIFLPNPPLVDVESIKYIDADGVLQTLDPNQYIVDNISEPARVVPAYGTSWPTTQNRINTVEIVFEAGYPDAASLPAPIRSWIMARVGTLYENRESVAVGARIVVAELPDIDGQLDPYRVVTF